MTSIGKENRSSQCLSYTERTVREKENSHSRKEGLGGVLWVYKVGLVDGLPSVLTSDQRGDGLPNVLTSDQRGDGLPCVPTSDQRGDGLPSVLTDQRPKSCPLTDQRLKSCPLTNQRLKSYPLIDQRPKSSMGV